MCPCQAKILVNNAAASYKRYTASTRASFLSHVVSAYSSSGMKTVFSDVVLSFEKVSFHFQGEDNLTCYTFNTHKAKHLFCKSCGVQSFYRPRSNPDGVGVMPHCLDPETVTEIKIKKFDGKDWEKCMEEHGKELRKMSEK